MKRNFTQSFKIRAVEKALNRGSETSLKEVASSLGIGFSTLNKWIVKAKNQEFETVSVEKRSSITKKVSDLFSTLSTFPWPTRPSVFNSSSHPFFNLICKFPCSC